MLFAATRFVLLTSLAPNFLVAAFRLALSKVHFLTALS
jgi:hypothetical protein